MSYRNVQKVELHCHQDGIADPAMLRVMQAQGLELPITPDALEALYPVVDYESFWRYMDAFKPYEGNLDAFRPILAIHLERLKAQRVVYTEISIGTSELRRDPAELIEKFQEFRDWLTPIEDGKLQVELLVGISRDREPEYVEGIAEVLAPLRRAGLIVGVVLAGPEAGNPIQPLSRAMQRFREAGLGIEIHAGEWAGPESVWDALEHGAPHRIGHGVAAFEDPRLLERIQREGVHIEMCPTSNIRTGSVRRIEEHPVRLARELGLSFSINTDDPGAFQCSMDGEFKLLEELFGFQDEDFEKIERDALAARFQQALRYGVG